MKGFLGERLKFYYCCCSAVDMHHCCCRFSPFHVGDVTVGMPDGQDTAGIQNALQHNSSTTYHTWYYVQQDYCNLWAMTIFLEGHRSVIAHIPGRLQLDGTQREYSYSHAMYGYVDVSFGARQSLFWPYYTVFRVADGQSRSQTVVYYY